MKQRHPQGTQNVYVICDEKNPVIENDKNFSYPKDRRGRAGEPGFPANMKQRYEIIDKIGEGKFGNVYRGIYCKPMKDRKLREPVAKKEGETLNQLQVLKNETTELTFYN